jgi:hemolysin III
VLPVRKWIKEPFPGLSHFFGAALSILAMIVLLEASAGKPSRILAFLIYGSCMFILYMASGLTHSVYCSPETGKWLDRFDYMGIYLLIAGTYTPVCLIAMKGIWGWGILSAEWVMAAIGIAAVFFGGGMSNALRAALYVAMGWLAVVAAVPVLHQLTTPALLWMLGGGVLYSVGAVVFVRNRPNLWPGRFCAHDLWHCMVLGGSGCHFVLMLCIIG